MNAIDPSNGHDHPLPTGGFARHYVCETVRCKRQRTVVFPIDDPELCPVRDDYGVCDRCGAVLTRIPMAEARARHDLALVGLDPPAPGEAIALWEKTRPSIEDGTYRRPSA